MRKMIDSKFDTLGYIPLDWDKFRLKYLCKISTGDSDTKDADEEGSYPFYVRSPVIERSTKYTFDGEGILMAGDGAGAGRIFHHAYGKYAVHQRVYRLYDFKNINSNYLFYYIGEMFPHEMDKGSAQSTVPSVRLPMLTNLPVLLPPIDEQAQIVSFLDEKCAAIDEAVTRQKEAIEKLKEYRKSVITKAVTKGLEDNTDMKDSCEGWCGLIPQNWEMVKIKYLFTIRKRIIGYDGPPVLSITQRGILPKDVESNEGQIAASYANYQIVNPGDFAMNHMDLLTGWVDISKFSGVTSPDYRVFTLNDSENNDPRYMLYLFQLLYFNKVFYGLGAGISSLGRWRLQASVFKNFKLPVPPLEEQKKIAYYISSKDNAIQTSIEKHQKIIDKLEEYKKSLVYNAVTGKIDCRKDGE